MYKIFIRNIMRQCNVLELSEKSEGYMQKLLQISWKVAVKLYVQEAAMYVIRLKFAWLVKSMGKCSHYSKKWHWHTWAVWGTAGRLYWMWSVNVESLDRVGPNKSQNCWSGATLVTKNLEAMEVPHVKNNYGKHICLFDWSLLHLPTSR